MRGMGIDAISLNGLEVVLVLHTQQDPQPEEWTEYVDLLVKLKKKNTGDVSKMRNIVITDGGGPNAKQRTQVQTEIYGGEPNKVAAISNSLSNPVKRGLATAVSWFNPGFLALPPDKWRNALQHLGLESDTRSILQQFERLQRKIPPVNSLALLLAQEKG